MKPPVDKDLAAAYARTFAGDDDGMRVLSDLVRKFPPDRLRFVAGQTTVEAAIIDGQSSVIVEILNAIKSGNPFVASESQPKP